MTREETKEAIKVMQAYIEGKIIEVKSKESEKWILAEEPSWGFAEYGYRIKPEPHYRPFKSVEEVMEAINQHGNFVRVSRGAIYKAIVAFAGEFIRIGGITESYESAYENYVFTDGTPFGVKEE